jgi:AraC family transcriptional regulator, positive regulator of tynA and feaB
MNPSSVFNGSPELDYEGWRDVVRLCGQYNPEGIEPNAFTGSMRPVSIFG